MEPKNVRLQIQKIILEDQQKIRREYRVADELPSEAEIENSDLILYIKALEAFMNNPKTNIRDLLENSRLLPHVPPEFNLKLIESGFASTLKLLCEDMETCTSAFDLISECCFPNSPFIVPLLNTGLPALLERSLSLSNMRYDFFISAIRCVSKLSSNSREAAEKLFLQGVFKAIIRLTVMTIPQVSEEAIHCIAESTTFYADHIFGCPNLTSYIHSDDPSVQIDSCRIILSLFRGSRSAVLSICSQPLIERVVALVETSSGPLLEKLLQVAQAMSGNDNRFTIELMKCNAIQVLGTIAKRSSEYKPIVMLSVSNLIMYGLEACISAIESGFLDVAMSSLKEGNLDEQTSAALLVSNILYTGDNSAIETIVRMEIPSILLDFLVLGNTQISTVIIDSFHKAILTERECISSSLYDFLANDQRIGTIYNMADDNDINLREAASNFIRIMGESRDE